MQNKLSFFLLFSFFVTACNTQPAFQPTFAACGRLSDFPAVAEAGYDCMEGTVADILVPSQNDSAFLVILERMKTLNAKFISCMQFVPGALKITGPEPRHDEIIIWAETTFRRARMAGIPYIVLGSGSARDIPDGFDKQAATQQFVNLCRQLAPLAQKYDVTVVIEPLSKPYSNFINSLAEGAAIVTTVNHPNIRLLCDIGHMMLEDEPADEIVKFGNLIHHCHITEKENRNVPGTSGDDFRPYLKALQQIQYKGCISIESRWTDLSQQLAPALQYIKQQI